MGMNAAMADLRLLESVCAVIDAGGVHRAAIELGYSQPTLTQRIQQLESQLGTTLFERSGKRLIPTAAAMLVYERGKHLLSQARALETEIAELGRDEAPSLRFGCSEPALSSRVLPVVADFLRDYPHARLKVEAGSGSYFAQQVLDGMFDFAITAPVTLEGRLSFTQLYEEHIGLLFPVSHNLAKKTRVSANDLQGIPMIFSESVCSYRQVFQSTLDRRGVAISPIIDMSSIPARIRAVQLGMGVALLPASAIETVPDGTVFVPLERGEGTLAIGVLRRADAGTPGRALQAFFDMLRIAMRYTSSRDKSSVTIVRSGAASNTTSAE